MKRFTLYKRSPEAIPSRWWWFITVRALFFAFGVCTLDRTLPLGTSPWLLSFGVIAGVMVGGVISRTSLLSRGLFTLIFALTIFIGEGFSLASVIPITFSPRVFLPVNVIEHLRLTTIFFGLGSLSTWLVVRFRHAITAEFFLILVIGLHLLSGHREFHFDAPKVVNQVAWNLDIEQLTTLVLFGAALSCLLLGYLFCQSFFLTAKSKFQSPTLRSFLVRSISLLLLSGIIFFVSNWVYQFYHAAAVAGGKLSNGVGSEAQEGMSPLGFHSALGGSNQPAALVRLDGDYKENPFSPMLYLRESALSEMASEELVIAGREYDADVSRTEPGRAFSRERIPDLDQRVEVQQSVFLLADQRISFAIDYPTSILPTHNPNPERFRQTYRATSLAPMYVSSDLAGREVGDPAWTKLDWEHYLKTHSDPRYGLLAKKLTEGVSAPVERALAVVQYLSQNAIYTLSPNHEVPTGQDPVAPFLFGDMRGYCVHFAHATVYMLRSLGIPARIGTGYLTDLSQAKDGHVLLRMSDRHAWAEIYVSGIGWIPFDTQPQHVESHADTQVDMKLLEDLMGLLEPGEEILPEKTKEGESSFEPEPSWQYPDKRIFGGVILGFLVLLGGAKLYLRYSWILPGNTSRKIKRAFRTFATSSQDYGSERAYGETWRAFSDRLAHLSSYHPPKLLDPFLHVTYGFPQQERWTPKEIRQFLVEDIRMLKAIPFWRRVLGWLNPITSLRFLLGGRW